MMKINSPIPSSVVVKPSEINREATGLFKDGQTILAKVVHSSPEEVVLDVGGHTVQAKVEGTAPSAGTVVLFGVRFLENGRIELQIQSHAREGLTIRPELFGSQLLNDALREQGLAVTSENLRLLNQILSDCQMKYGLQPEPKLAAFLMANHLPVTSGTFLFSWLQQDGRIRDHLWNLLERSNLLDVQFMAKLGDSPETLLKFFQQLQEGIPGKLSEASGLVRAFKNEVLENLLASMAKNGPVPEGWQGQNPFQSGPGSTQTGEIVSRLLNLVSQGKAEAVSSDLLDLLGRMAAFNDRSVSGLSQPVGNPLNQLVRLALSENGQLNLDVLASGGTDQGISRQTLLAALGKQGLAESPANLRLLEDLLSGFQREYQLALDPGLAAMLMAQTIQTAGNSAPHPVADHAQALVKMLLNLGGAAPETAEGRLLAGSDPSAASDATSQMLRDTFSREGTAGKTGRPEVIQNAEKIIELLTNGMSWRSIRDQSSVPDSRWGAMPFLVQDAQGLIRECVIHWQEEQGSIDPEAREQTVRLVIPTENLGDIGLELKIGPAGTRIRFKVKSETVKDYLLDREIQLLQATGCEAQIRVETGERSDVSRGALNLWL